jgi:hypothetical protein
MMNWNKAAVIYYFSILSQHLVEGVKKTAYRMVYFRERI